MMKPIRRTPLRQSHGLEAPPLRLAGTAHGSGPLVWERQHARDDSVSVRPAMIPQMGVIYPVVIPRRLPHRPLYSRLNILIQPEEVRRVVLLFHRRQARVVLAIGGPHAFRLIRP